MSSIRALPASQSMFMSSRGPTRKTGGLSLPSLTRSVWGVLYRVASHSMPARIAAAALVSRTRRGRSSANTCIIRSAVVPKEVPTARIQDWSRRMPLITGRPVFLRNLTAAWTMSLVFSSARGATKTSGWSVVMVSNDAGHPFIADGLLERR